MIVSITKRLSLIRGQTLVVELTAKDEDGARVDLTDATIYAWVLADMKLASTQASIKLASAATAGHRVGIVLDDDQVANPGDYVITFTPEDTESLTPGGSNDPYFWGVMIKDVDGNEWSHVNPSFFDLHQTAVVVP